jgi:D-xylose transport system permease protein
MKLNATADITRSTARRSVSTRLADLRTRLLSGDIGSVPVVSAIVVIWATFWYLNPNFLTPRNLTNLVLQSAALGMVSVGIVVVLLLGEVDLSVGQVSGLCAAIMAVLNVKDGLSPVLAIVIAVIAGLSIGAFQGVIVTQFRIPSFVVTLAGLLAWQGALLYVLGPTGTLNIFDPTIDALTGTFLPVAGGWFLSAFVIAWYSGSLLYRRGRRLRASLEVRSYLELAGRIVFVSAVILAATAVLNADRGVPLALLILLGFVNFFYYVTRRTTFGRYVFAVGGNAEAARRVGIPVDRVRVAGFALAGGMAACGGILAASRLFAVNQSSGGSDFLVNVIAAAVIGGTSLFGGRGTVWSAVSGALVIQSISNGMDLLALESSTKYMVTGAVLFSAVIVDALARRGRKAAGRA